MPLLQSVLPAETVLSVITHIRSICNMRRCTKTFLIRPIRWAAGFSCSDVSIGQRLAVSESPIRKVSHRSLYPLLGAPFWGGHFHGVFKFAVVECPRD